MVTEGALKDCGANEVWGETARSLMVAGIDEVYDAPVFRLTRFFGLEETEDRTEPLENEDTDSRVAA